MVILRTVIVVSGAGLGGRRPASLAGIDGVSPMDDDGPGASWGLRFGENDTEMRKVHRPNTPRNKAAIPEPIDGLCTEHVLVMVSARLIAK